MGVAESMPQNLLPSPQPVAIAGATVGEDVQLGGVGVASATAGAAPAVEAVHGEEGCVMGLTDDDSAGIGVRIKDAVTHGKALRLGTVADARPSGTGRDIRHEMPLRLAVSFASGFHEQLRGGSWRVAAGLCHVHLGGKSLRWR